VERETKTERRIKSTAKAINKRRWGMSRIGDLGEVMLIRKKKGKERIKGIVKE
jgi:hypothetical protein